MKKTCCFLALLVAFTATAQKSQLHFSTTVAAGLLEGGAGSAFQLKTVNGVQCETWTAGIGAGLDYYHTRSIPLFLNLQKLLGKKEKAPFVYASGGYHFPWLKGEEGSGMQARGGLYFDAGVGYQVPVKKSALFFSAGYSQKRFTTTNKPEAWIEQYPYYPPPFTKFDYSLRRFSIQTGLRF